jgi:hypothetical protein
MIEIEWVETMPTAVGCSNYGEATNDCICGVVNYWD